MNNQAKVLKTVAKSRIQRGVGTRAASQATTSSNHTNQHILQISNVLLTACDSNTWQKQKHKQTDRANKFANTTQRGNNTNSQAKVLKTAANSRMQRGMGTRAASQATTPINHTNRHILQISDALLPASNEKAWKPENLAPGPEHPGSWVSRLLGSEPGNLET